MTQSVFKCRTLSTSLLVFLLTGACSHSMNPLFRNPPSPQNWNHFENAGYVSLEFAPDDFDRFRALKKQIENKENVILKDRGEAHITVLTPPEMKILRAHVSDAEISKILETFRPKDVKLEWVCWGRGSKETLKTYYVVLRAPTLRVLREQLETKLTAHKGEAGLFKAENFYPHITIGFTERDLHAEEGVFKTMNTCQGFPR